MSAPVSLAFIFRLTQESAAGVVTCSFYPVATYEIRRVPSVPIIIRRYRLDIATFLITAFWVIVCPIHTAPRV